MVPRPWHARLPLAVVLVIGWLAIALYCYPGFMSFDSFEQLAQARGLAPYSDWHPPIMALTWKLLELVVAGPFPMIVLQCGLLLTGLYALFARVRRPWLAAAATLAVFLWPPVFTLMAVVWKDSLMAGVLVASFAALTSARRGYFGLGIGGLVYATMLRHNAIIAIAPLLVLLAPRRRTGVALVVVVALVAQLGNHVLVQQRKHPSISIAVFDVVGVLRYSGPISDDQLAPMLADAPLVERVHIQQRAKRVWDPRGWPNLVGGEQRFMDLPTTDAQCAAIWATWRMLLREHPVEYLRARLRVFREVIGLQKHPTWSWEIQIAAHDDQNLLRGYGIHVERPSWQVAMSFWLGELSDTSAVFRAWPYLLVALALLVVMRRRREVVALLASGVLYEAALFVVAPSADFRYSTWLVLATVIALVLRFCPAGYTTSRARSTV